MFRSPTCNSRSCAAPRKTSFSINGRPAVLFTTDNGVSYIQMRHRGRSRSIRSWAHESDEVLLEVLAVPDETVGGYPALRIYSAAMAINPKNGEPVEIPITADQVYTMDEQQLP